MKSGYVKIKRQNIDTETIWRQEIAADKKIVKSFRLVDGLQKRRVEL